MHRSLPRLQAIVRLSGRISLWIWDHKDWVIMDDFGNVIYLDVEKTGSSFVSSVLAEILPDAARVFKKHARLQRPPNPGDVLLTTVRNPVSQWVSLYHFGTVKKGPLRKAIESFGPVPFRYDGTLDDFHLWLAFCLDGKNAKSMLGNYVEGGADMIGYQTFRYLRLNLAVLPRRLRHHKKREDMYRFVTENSLGAHVMRTEHLREDLVQAARTVLADVLPDPERAVKTIQSHSAKNVSKAPAFRVEDLPAETVETIWDREWLLKRLFFSEI